MVKEPQDYKSKEEEVTEEEVVIPGVGDTVSLEGDDYKIQRSVTGIQGMRILTKIQKRASFAEEGESTNQDSMETLGYLFEFAEYVLGERQADKLFDKISKQKKTLEEEYATLTKVIGTFTGAQDADSPK